MQFTALAEFSDGTALDWTTAVAWSSSDEASVTMGDSLGTFGLATSVVSQTSKSGVFTITATDTANNISGTATLIVKDPLYIIIRPENPLMAVGREHQFTAEAVLSDLTSGGITTITRDLTSSPTLSWNVDYSADLRLPKPEAPA